MHERLMQVSIPLSNPSPSSPTPSASSVSSSARQLRAELRQAVERDMVSTRSQDPTPAKALDDGGLKGGKDTSAEGRKRKTEHDGDGSSPSQPASKKRRAVSKSKDDLASTAMSTRGQEREDEEQTRLETNGTRPQASDGQIVRTHQNLPLRQHSPSASPHSSSNAPNGHTRQNVMVVIPTKTPDGSNTTEATPHSSNESAIPPPTSNPTKKKKTSPTPTPTPSENSPIPAPIPTTKTPTPPPPSPKANHKRFSSQSPDPPSHSPKPPLSHPPEPQSPHLPPSDDEAPETVTASTGQTQALTKANDEAKAAAKLKEERKAKRKERDARLKAQAKGMRKSHSKHKTKPTASSPDTLAEAQAASSANPAIPSPNTKPHPPALLPIHILTDEPKPLPSIPPPNPSLNPQRKNLALPPKHPKDIKKGHLKIRVLEGGNGILPPKASSRGKAVREKWLMGRGVQRKGMGGGGFVRG